MTRHGVTIAGERKGNHTFVQAAYTCDECGWLQIAHASRPPSTEAGAGSSWDDVKTWKWLDTSARIEWWPAVGVAQTFEDVPDHIADAASEAHRCYSIGAYRGATALARAVIESTAKEKGITKGLIYAKIDELFKQGHVRAHIRDAAHEVRHLGNEVAHGDFVDPIDVEESEETLALMAEVLQEVFQSPARVERARARREAKKGSQVNE